MDAPDGSPSGCADDQVFEHFESLRSGGVQPGGGCGAIGDWRGTFRRWRQRFEDEGEAGLLDRRLGKASGKRVPDRSEEVEGLYRTRYAGFTAEHFHEHLVKEHNFSWGYTWTKTFLYSKGLLEKAKRRGAHRRKRERRPLPGMMLHQDGW